MTRVKDRRECPTLDADIAQYLASGGRIKHCPPCTYHDKAEDQNIHRQNRQTWERAQGRAA